MNKGSGRKVETAGDALDLGLMGLVGFRCKKRASRARPECVDGKVKEQGMHGGHYGGNRLVSRGEGRRRRAPRRLLSANDGACGVWFFSRARLRRGVGGACAGWR
ncbi:hypothetical protein TRVL_06322 [Trypanosoma vivax]|nr:hypothetical protein TRVL_06322 [Trypanosoma vivax]